MVAAGLATVAPGALGAPAWLGLSAFAACDFALSSAAAPLSRSRSLVAFSFGLVHGLAFAGVLEQADLSADRLVPSLLGFNLGVEVGQVALASVALAGLRVLTRRPATQRIVLDAGTSLLLALGVYWSTTRMLA